MKKRQVKKFEKQREHELILSQVFDKNIVYDIKTNGWYLRRGGVRIPYHLHIAYVISEDLAKKIREKKREHGNIVYLTNRNKPFRKNSFMNRYTNQHWLYQDRTSVEEILASRINSEFASDFEKAFREKFDEETQNEYNLREEINKALR